MPEKILIMDEQKDIRISLSHILADEGYVVVATDNATDGLRLCQTEAPDLVLADARMPIGGCLDQLRKNKDSGPVADLVVLAAEDCQGMALDWLGKGAYDYLFKPLSETGVVAAVRRALQKRGLVVQNRRLTAQVEQNTIKDALTDLYNDRFMHKCLIDEIVRASRYKHEFLLIMASIDDFSKLNEAYGREFGDFILTRIAQLLKDNLRLTDTIFRYGGRRFLMLLPETGKFQGVHVAERILEIVRYHDFSRGGFKARVTLSMGGVEFPLEAHNVPSLMALAHRRLECARKDGQDCFYFETDEAFLTDVSPEN